MIKRFPVFLFISFIAFFSTKSHAQIDVEEVTFDKEVFDFGEVSFGTAHITATFIFTNNSSFNFEIKEVKASCGCTVPSWPKNPILPGMKGIITAKFDPSNLAGEVDKSIEIFANYNKVMSKVLNIHGFIREPLKQDLTQYVAGQMGYLRLSMPAMGFGDIVNTKRYSKPVLIVNDYNRPLRLMGIEKKPDWVDVEFSNMTVEPGDTIIAHIQVDGSKINDFGLVNDKILFATNDIFFKTKLLNISMNVSPDFGALRKRDLKAKPTIYMAERTFDIGSIQKGSKKNITVEIRNTGKSTLRILKAKSDCSCTVLNNLVDSIAPGQKTTATLTFDSVFLSGKAEKEVILYTNDPSNYQVVIKVYADVKEN